MDDRTAHLTPDYIVSIMGGRKTGHNTCSVPGPGHSRTDTSLAIAIDANAPDGFICHSFAGDDDIACKDYVREKLGLPKWEANEAKFNQAKPQQEKRVVAEYIYRQADGTPYMKVVRQNPKGFFQQHWSGKLFINGGPFDGAILPYRLPELLAAEHDDVFITEGEKDADNLSMCGFTVTTNAGGAGKWRANLNEYFNGKNVYILPDNDEAGDKHAQLVASHLSPVAREIRIIRLPGLPQKGDVSDWLRAGGTPNQLIDLVKAAPIFEAASNSPQQEEIGMSAEALCAKQFPPVKFVVRGYIVEGLTLFAGKPKAGKSWLVLHAALAVARGGFTLGEVHCPEGGALYCALEDNWRRLQQRLQKLLGGQPAPKGLTLLTEMPRLANGGLDVIREWIEHADKPRLIVVDVLAKVRDPLKKNQGLYEADYAAMQGLKALADEYGIAIIVVHHLRKMDAEDPLDQISGTTGLAGAADSVLVLHKTANGTTLKGRGRDLDEIDKAIVWNRNSCTWTILGEASEVTQKTGRGAIVAVLRDAKAPLSPQEIADLCNISLPNSRKLLVRMERDGEVFKIGRGRYIHPDRDDLNPSMKP